MGIQWGYIVGYKDIGNAINLSQVSHGTNRRVWTWGISPVMAPYGPMFFLGKCWPSIQSNFWGGLFSDKPQSMFSNHQNVRNITKYHLYHKTKKNWAGDFKSSLERSQYPSNFPIKPSDFSDQRMELEMVLILQWLFICCWLWIHWIHPKKSCFGFFSKNLLFTIIQIHDLSDSNIFKICRMPSHTFRPSSTGWRLAEQSLQSQRGDHVR